MNLFSRLFGKKPKAQAPAEPELKQEKQPAQEKPATSEQQPPPTKKPEKPAAPKPQKPEAAANAPLVKDTVPWRTFSIFISSTFADMQAERDHLKNVVFPAVEEELQKRRIKLEIVDLRWGVDTTSMEQEDEREANVLKVCLDEIKRCRPFFVGLLGDRYGWVPPEKRMADAVDGEELTAPLKGKSVTDLEIEFGVLASREQLIRSAFYFREPLPYENFTPKRAALFSDRHNPELSEKENAERKTALDDLKEKIRKHFDKESHSEKVKTYAAAWDAENEKVTALEEFGERVMKDILAECESHAKETWNKAPQNWQEQELALLDAFINQHTHVTTFITEKGEEHVPTFCGRKSLLKELKQHLLSADAENWGLVLTGESGSGKSAVFSMVHKMMEQEDCMILAHSAGLSPRAKHVADLLMIWSNLLRKDLSMEQVMEEIVAEESPLKPSLDPGLEKTPEKPIEKLQQQFAELLSMASKNKRVVLLIDALDRFEPTGRAQAMSWLPALMPRNVRLLCTAITGTEERAVKYHRGLQSKSIDLFTPEEAKEMLAALGRRNHKTLPAGIVKMILEKKTDSGLNPASSPLWLSLAMNMLMALDQDDFEQMSKLEGRGDQQIGTYLTNLAKGFDPLPGKLFLSLIEKAGILFGKDFTRAVFNYIAISRNGLREKDLEALLPAEGIAWDPLRYAMLRRWFRAHLVMQGEELQWNLMHNILRNSLHEKLTDNAKRLHKNLITHFLLLVATDTMRSTETMYHLTECGNLEQAAEYYGNVLTEEEVYGATSVLCEKISSGKNWIENAKALPKLLKDDAEKFDSILRRYLKNLNEKLKIEGNIESRFQLMTELEKTLNTSTILGNKHYGYDVAKLMEGLGDIYMDMGQINDALKYYHMYAEFLLEQCDYKPDYAPFKIEYACSLYKLGNISKLLGSLDRALKSYEIGYNFIQGLLKVENNPIIEPMKGIFTILNNTMGNIHNEMGNIKKSIAFYENSISINEKLHKVNPRNEIYKYHLAFSQEGLSSNYMKLGKMDVAIRYAENSLGLYKELFEANPYHEVFAKKFAISNALLGDIHFTMGNLDKCLLNTQNANDLIKKLYESNPTNESLNLILATVNMQLGIIYQRSDKFDDSLRYLKVAFAISQEIYAKNPANVKIEKLFLNSIEKLGSILISLKKFEEAKEINEQFCTVLKVLHKTTSENEPWNLKLAITYGKIGGINKELGFMSEALINFTNCNLIFKDLTTLNPNNIEYLEGLSFSYYCLILINKIIGNESEAQKYFRDWNNTNSNLSKKKVLISKQEKGSGMIYEQIYNHRGGLNSKFERKESDQPEHLIIETDNKKIDELLEKASYQQVMEILVNEESRIRELENNGYRFQACMEQQANVLALMGNYKEALQKYRIQAEVCARNKLIENYVDSLLSQAELLIEHLNNPQMAKSLLNEAILMAEEHHLDDLLAEANRMLKSIDQKKE